jgi:hypothetical protein
MTDSDSHEALSDIPFWMKRRLLVGASLAVATVAGPP